MAARGHIRDFFYHLFGKNPGFDDLVAIFGVRLDEAGTDGHSPYAIIAGGLASPTGWDELERLWGGLMNRRGVKIFHNREFDAGDGDFAGWGKLKKSNLIRSMEKIINKTVAFQIAVAVEHDTHVRIKKEMQGTRGFKADSDVGLCFRIASIYIRDKIAAVDPGARIHFIVEDGPYSADMATIYQDIKKTQGAKYRPARHAETLAGFASVPKGKLRGLEAADFLAGRGIDDLKSGRFVDPGRKNQDSMIADSEFLQRWHQGMLKESGHRQSHGQRKIKNAPSSGGQSC